MQCISLDRLWKLITKGAFMPPLLEDPPELSGTTAILQVFQTDGQHERITDIYVVSWSAGLIPTCILQTKSWTLLRTSRATSRRLAALLRLGATPARGTPFASLSATVGVPCSSPRTIVLPLLHLHWGGGDDLSYLILS